MNDKLVSVIIPNFNRPLLIIEAMDSVAVQTWKNWECIVVDDGSTDNSIEVIKAYCQKNDKFRLIQRDRQPKGAPTCRNIGLENANGEYIIFLDSDDLLAPYCVETRLKEIIDTEYDFVAFPMLIFEHKIENGRILTNIDTLEDPLTRYFRGDNLWQTSQPIWKKSALKQLGGFDERLKSGQEADLHIRMLLNNMKYKSVLNSFRPDCYCRHHVDHYRIGTDQTLKNSESRLMTLNKIIRHYKEQQQPTPKELSISTITTIFYLLEDGRLEDAKKLIQGLQIKKNTTRIFYWLYKLSFNKIKGFRWLKHRLIDHIYDQNLLMKVPYEGKTTI